MAEPRDPIAVEATRGARPGCIVRFTVSGLLTGAQSDRAGAQLAALSEQAEVGSWAVFDFTGVQVVGSAFMARMVMLYKRLTPKGSTAKRVAICCAPAPLRETLSIAMIHRLIPIVNTREEALALVIP